MTDDLDDALPDQAIDAVLARIEDETSGSSSPAAIMADTSEIEPIPTEYADLLDAIAFIKLGRPSPPTPQALAA